MLYNSDPSNTTAFYSDPARPDELRRWVRNMAVMGHIDTYVQEVFAEAMTMFWQSAHCPYDERYQHQRFVPMMENGLMPLEVLAAECHRQGMEFIAGFRMNDRHGHHPDHFEALGKIHPEWILRDYKPSWRGAPAKSHAVGCSLDYSQNGVRDLLFAIIEELTSRFDIDGIEFNFTRLLECFPREKAEASQPIMTEFIQRVRIMLDDYGGRRPQGGKALLFGARVPQQLEGCKKWGLDIATWIEEGLVDYVAPSDFGFTDFNETYEDFTALGRKHGCLVYPQVQARLKLRDDRDQTLEQYRAALQNFYAAGADGFSTQNYFFQWGPKFEPPGHEGLTKPEKLSAALGYLKLLRDPAALRAGDRHYPYYPLWGSGGTSAGISGIYKPEQIVLERRDRQARGAFRFRLCEHLQQAAGATLLLRPGIVRGDEIEVSLNNKTIPAAAIEYQWSEDQEHPLSCRFSLRAPPAVYGDNILGLRLLKGAPGAREPIALHEVEVMVQA